MSENADSKIDEVLKVIEDIERVSRSGFGSKEKQMLVEIVESLREIRESLDLIKYKMGIETGIWRKFENSDIEWAFTRTSVGEPLKELKDVVEVLDKEEYSLWVQIGAFEYRFSGPEGDPKRFIHRRIFRQTT